MKTVDLARLATGALAVLSPDAVIRVTGSRPDPGLRTTARILGARYLAQSAVCIATPSRRIRTVGAAVDLLHGASMVLVASVDGRRRRAAMSSAGVAAAFAAADLSAR